MAAEETPQAARVRAGVLRAAVLDDYLRHGDYTRASAEAAAAAMGVSIARFYTLRSAYGAARTIESVTPRAPEGGRGKGRIDPALDRALRHALVTRYFIGSQPSASRFYDQFCGEYLYGQGVVDPDTGENDRARSATGRRSSQRSARTAVAHHGAAARGGAGCAHPRRAGPG